MSTPPDSQVYDGVKSERTRARFEASVKANQGKHGMLCNLSRFTDGEYRSACERSAWWAWQEALKDQDHEA